jgi:putative membrane protein
MSKQLIFAALAGAFVYSMLAIAKPVTAPKSDAEFLAMAAQADMTMAHIGKMAEDRATGSKVKDFANTLVQDHTTDYQRLTALAAKLGDSVPKSINERNNRTIAELDHSRGKTFDHAFLTKQSAEHEKLIDAFKWEAEHGSTPAIKAYASQTLPTIERHLHDAEGLIKQQRS